LPSGAYGDSDEWSGLRDFNSEFEAYLSVEHAYWCALNLVLEQLGVQELRLDFVAYVPSLFESEAIPEPLQESLSFLAEYCPVLGGVIRKDVLERFTKAALRDAIGWQGQGAEGTEVAFGDDLYIYVRSDRSIEPFQHENVWVERIDWWPFD
jgi:hypothetical protein